jgi:PAS domain S-box-containing protein
VTAQLFGGRTAARALGFVFLAGSAIGVVTLLLPHDDVVDDGPLYALVATATALGLLFVARADRMTQPRLHAAVALGTLLVAAGNLPAGTTTLYPIIYMWMLLYAFTFFGRRAALAHLALAGASYVVVLLLQHDPSSPVVRWVLVLGTPLVGGLLVSRVMELAAERAHVLEDSERRTRAIFQGAPDAFVSMDPDGKVVAWNREAERMFFISEAEALGRDGAELMLAPEDREAHLVRRMDHLQRPDGAEPARHQLELVRRDGSRFPAEAVINRVTTEGRSLLVAFIRDVTDAAQQERERAQLIRAQAARDEAEQMAGIVHGLQVLLDAALPHVRLEDMLQALLPRLCEVVSGDAAAVFLVDEEDGMLTLRASTAGIDPDAAPVRAGPREGLAGRVAELGRAEMFQGASTRDALDPALREADSVLCVPLLARGTVTGVVEVGVAAPRRFGEDDLTILGLAADRVGLALDQARIYEREHRIAETLQRSLLPDRLPQVPGLDVAVEYLPAAAEAEVGGDWYDVIPIDSARVGIVMGDVAGKGLAAASLVGRLRSAIRAYALEGHDPPTVVERLNRVMWAEIEDTEMATLIYAVLDPAEGRISWVNAGHLPPLLLDAQGESRFLEGPRAVPLGVMPYVSYEAGERDLPPGASLVLYTDGLVERPGESIDDGLERLREAAVAAGDGVERLCRDILRGLVPGGASADDVALLALHIPMLTERFALELACDPSRLAPMRSLLRRWLRHAGGSPDEVMEILTATGEAAANAIEHGRTGSDPALEVVGTARAGEIEISISDHGRWREGGSSDGDRGRGLVLMRALMDSVDVTPSPGGTTVRMRRRLRNPRREEGAPAAHAPSA